jgi:hypothetical protein
MSNTRIWENVKQPPPHALKQINAGRLKGKTDINPQWRYQALTEQFGPCGTGWKYEVKKVWNEPVSDGQIFAFAEVHLYFKEDDKWSDPIPGIGGSMLIVKEKAGLHASDEGYKMAITDALSVACKMIGVAADIYAGRWDGKKYAGVPVNKNSSQKEPVKRRLFNALVSKGVKGEGMTDFVDFMKAGKDKLSDDDMEKIIPDIETHIADWRAANNPPGNPDIPY